MPAAWLRWRLGEGRLHVFQHKDVVSLRLEKEIPSPTHPTMPTDGVPQYCISTVLEHLQRQ